MAITTLESYKTFYGITDTSQDGQINGFIPVVEADYLIIRNVPFEVDALGEIIYPSGSETVANMMINFKISNLDNNGKDVSSEKIGTYSVTFKNNKTIEGYPVEIVGSIHYYNKGC